MIWVHALSVPRESGGARDAQDVSGPPVTRGDSAGRSWLDRSGVAAVRVPQHVCPVLGTPRGRREFASETGRYRVLNPHAACMSSAVRRVP